MFWLGPLRAIEIDPALSTYWSGARVNSQLAHWTLHGLSASWPSDRQLPATKEALAARPVPAFPPIFHPPPSLTSFFAFDLLRRGDPGFFASGTRSVSWSAEPFGLNKVGPRDLTIPRRHCEYTGHKAHLYIGRSLCRDSSFPSLLPRHGLVDIRLHRGCAALRCSHPRDAAKEGQLSSWSSGKVSHWQCVYSISVSSLLINR